MRDYTHQTAPNQFVEAETEDLPPGRALDLAAGEGRNAIWLAERGWVVTVVEFSKVALEQKPGVAKSSRAAIARNAAGMTRRSAARGALMRVSVIFVSITVRPFNSYFREVAMRTPSTVCQSPSTRS